MDKSKYDRTTIATFDIIGAYFVDVFYNNHYLLAEDQVKMRAKKSITDAYRDVIRDYVIGIRNEHLCKTAISSLYSYFRASSGISTFEEFENRVLSQFIPPEFYANFVDNQKDSSLCNIVVCVARDIGNAILEPKMFSRIIDDHQNTANVLTLQDCALNILILQRQEYYSKFYKEVTKAMTVQYDKESFERLRDAYIEEKRTCCDLKNEKEIAVSLISQLRDALKLEKEKCSRLESQLRAKPRQEEHSQIANLFVEKAKQPSPTVQAAIDSDDDEDLTEDDIYRLQMEAAKRNVSNKWQ